MISGSCDFMKSFASILVSVNMRNTKEVEMLIEVFVAWPEELGEIEILFKVPPFHVSNYNKTTLANLSSITFASY